MVSAVMSKRKSKQKDNKLSSRPGVKVIVAMVVVAIVVIAVAIRTSGPWLDLRAKYPGPDSGDLRLAGIKVELRSAGRVGVAVYHAVAPEWGEATLSLSLRSPMKFFFQPIRIPVEAIASCEKRDMSGAWTGIELWVADPGIGVGFPAYDQKKLLTWCRERGIRIIEEKPAAR